MATRKPRADTSTVTYTVLTPVEHDQVAYVPGDTIDLDADTAQPLLDCKAIAPIAAA